MTISIDNSKPKISIPTPWLTPNLKYPYVKNKTKISTYLSNSILWLTYGASKGGRLSRQLLLQSERANIMPAVAFDANITNPVAVAGLRLVMESPEIGGPISSSDGLFQGQYATSPQYRSPILHRFPIRNEQLIVAMQWLPPGLGLFHPVAPLDVDLVFLLARTINLNIPDSHHCRRLPTSKAHEAVHAHRDLAPKDAKAFRL